MHGKYTLGICGAMLCLMGLYALVLLAIGRTQAAANVAGSDNPKTAAAIAVFSIAAGIALLACQFGFFR